MPSYYTVVRYLPSALAEEFVNIGVLAYGDGRVRGKSLDNWRRASRFADDDLNNALDFQDWVEEAMVGQTGSRSPLDEQMVQRIVSEWSGSLQLSTPRASLLSPDDLLEQIAATYLKEPTPQARAHDKRYAASLAAAGLADAIRRSTRQLHVQTRRPLPGKVRPRVFDIMLTNGVPKHAVQCLSFQVQETETLLKQVDATAFAIEDVRRSNQPIPISVFALRPTASSTAYNHASETFKEVGAEFITDDQVQSWAEKTVASASGRQDAKG